MARITEKDIREFMLDKPEINPLLRGVRWTSEDIASAIENAIDEANCIPPMLPELQYTEDNFPYKAILKQGVAGSLLRSAAINQASNQISYSADGIQVNDFDKADIFAKLGNDYWQGFQARVADLKLQANAACAFGTSVSEYHYIRH